MEHIWRGPPVVRLPLIAERHSRRVVFAVFVMAAGGTSIGLIAAVAFWTQHPLIVPSLGPTAFLVFNRSQSQVSRPRNVLFGHLIGAISGWVSLSAFGLLHAPSVITGGVTAPRIGAAAMSIALTSAVMILTDTEHGPAAATTLIVSLGFMTTLTGLALLMGGVVALTLEGLLIDRFVGLDLPLWSDRKLREPGPARRGRLVVLPGGPASRARADGQRPPAPAGKSTSRYVVGPRQGRPVSLAEGHAMVKLEAAVARTSYSLLEVVFEPHSAAPMIHVHADFTESYLVLDGHVRGHVGTEEVQAGPGAVVWVPPGVPHALYNPGSQAATIICVTAPAHQSTPEFIP